ncbi:MAG TPA: YHS domain-containing protein [Candidatus Nanoarchaeia archaeon]|nr:YHS domain-containing protein [Candidatus Nanoarchaeia archaeon]
MATDPTCGMEVDENDKSTLLALAGGKKNYFCSNECRDEFLKNKG